MTCADCQKILKERDKCWLDNNKLVRLVKMAFVSGFRMSGEGFNGEYPVSDENWDDEKIYQELKNAFLRQFKRKILRYSVHAGEVKRLGD